MGISNYGLWKGTPTSWDGKADTDHGHLIFTDGTDSKSHEADVNIMSSGKETRLVYWLVSSYKAQKPSTSQLQALPKGFSKQSGSGSLALDFIREGLVDVSSGVLLSHDAKNPGEKGDILSYLDPIMDEAVSSKATVYIWGSQYKDGDGSSGIHDIHMNQGSAGSFEKENGTYQDGGVVVEFADGRWEGVFLAFASQATKTDTKGDPDGPTFASALGGTSSSSPSGSGTPSTGGGTTAGAGTGTGTTPAADPSQTTKYVIIEAALVNPVGPDDTPTSGSGETVYVLNKSSKAQSLEGWAVGNGKGGSQELSGEISANAKKGVSVSGFRLSNKGGEIVLKDAQGKTVSEVSYTEKQARKEGKLLYFAN